MHQVVMWFRHPAAPPFTLWRWVTRRHEKCGHVSAIHQSAHARAAFCEQCLLEGTSWSSLRVCLTCGRVSCGPDSSSDHAAQHYAETDHPIVSVASTDASSRWCYPDERFV